MLGVALLAAFAVDPLKPPPFPNVSAYLPSSLPAFGRASAPLWSFDRGWVNLNHGSYGSPPRAVLAVQREWVKIMEGNPEMFERYWQYDLLDRARAKPSIFFRGD